MKKTNYYSVLLFQLLAHCPKRNNYVSNNEQKQQQQKKNLQERDTDYRPKKIEIKTFFKKQAKIYDGFCSVK